MKGGFSKGRRIDAVEQKNNKSDNKDKDFKKFPDINKELYPFKSKSSSDWVMHLRESTK